MLASASRAGSRSSRSQIGEGTPDAVLIERIAASNRLAMQVLYLRHRTRVYRQILRIVRDQPTAEDLLSETFLDVWRKAASFRNQSSVPTWLSAIARHKAISETRRRSYQRMHIQYSPAPDEAEDPEACLQKKDQFSALRRSLAQLSPKHRRVVNLFYFEDKSAEEVAAMLSAPRNTVKTRVFYARRHLWEMLRAAGITQSAP